MGPMRVDGGAKWRMVARSGESPWVVGRREVDVADGAAAAPAPAFLGTHQPRLDEKGRLFLPAKYRDSFTDGVVITRGQEHCLYVFPSAEFARLYGQLRQAPVTSKAARDYQRVFLSGAEDSVPDKSGRVTIGRRGAWGPTAAAVRRRGC